MSVWTVLCDHTAPRARRIRNGRRKKMKRKYRQGNWLKDGIMFQLHKHTPNPRNVSIEGILLD